MGYFNKTGQISTSKLLIKIKFTDMTGLIPQPKFFNGSGDKFFGCTGQMYFNSRGKAIECS